MTVVDDKIYYIIIYTHNRLLVNAVIPAIGRLDNSFRFALLQTIKCTYQNIYSTYGDTTDRFI